MDSIPTYAIVPSCGRTELGRCLDSLGGQIDGIVVVTNGPYLGADLVSVDLVHDQGPDRNISRWWNLGLEAVARLADGPQWNALVVNDDVIMGPGSVATLTSQMRAHGASLAFPGHTERLLREPFEDRLTGWCFTLPGEQGLRADESYVWWCGDNDLDLRARSAHGSLRVSGVDVQHTAPNAYTNDIPELSIQAGRDVETFRAQWGRLPY